MDFKITPAQGTWDTARFVFNYFNEINKNVPSTINLNVNIEINKFNSILNKYFTENSNRVFHTSVDYKAKDNINPVLKYYNLANGSVILSVSIETVKKKQYINYINIAYHLSYEDKIYEIAKLIGKSSKKERRINKIHVVVQENDTLRLASFIIKKPKFSLEDNYDNITDLHRSLLKRLNTNGDKGIGLFYGEPGCGKTNYIRYLLASIKKRVIYLPPDMAGQISSPAFITFLMNYPDSVLVIEDAENIIKKREGGGTQSISNLLNLSDGLLSDILNIQIIATFNCNYKEIDEALLRKGRLICKHEFGKLSKLKGQMLSDKLGFKTIINKEMSLSDIYNQDEKDYQVKRTPVGFKPIGFKKDELLDSVSEIEDNIDIPKLMYNPVTNEVRPVDLITIDRYRKNNF